MKNFLVGRDYLPYWWSSGTVLMVFSYLLRGPTPSLDITYMISKGMLIF